MDLARIKALREEIAARRKDFPCIQPYQRTYAILGPLNREAGNLEAKQFAEDVELYIGLCESLVRKQASLLKPEAEAINLVIAYALEMSMDPEYEGGSLLLPPLISYKIGGTGTFDETEEAYLLCAIVNFHKREDRPWRGKPYAKELKALLTKSVYPRQIYESLSAFYKIVLDYRQAKEVAMLGYRALKDSKEFRADAAYLYRDALTCALYLDEKNLPSEAEIVDQFGDLTDIVMNYPRYASMKLDPVMNTPEFQAVYDEVMEQAQDNYEEFKVKSVLSLWFFMEEGFAKAGITWASPATLNPQMRFD